MMVGPTDLKSVTKVRWSDIDDSDVDSPVNDVVHAMQGQDVVPCDRSVVLFSRQGIGHASGPAFWHRQSESDFAWPDCHSSMSWYDQSSFASGSCFSQAATPVQCGLCSVWANESNLVSGASSSQAEHKVAWVDDKSNFASFHGFSQEVSHLAPRVRGRGRKQRSAVESSAKVKGTGKGKGRNNVNKFQCQFSMQIEEEPKFRVCRRLLGPAGANVKAIAADTDAKLRLRGVGSKFLEGPKNQESPDPLMLCVSVSGRREEYEHAKQSIIRLLEQIYEDYDTFLMRRGEATMQLEVQFHEGARAGSR